MTPFVEQNQDELVVLIDENTAKKWHREVE
jgi:hypothetical protein